MMIVKQAQLDALADRLKEKFIRLMAAHLGQHFPDRCATLGPERVRAQILEGLAVADTFGIKTEQDVAGLIHFRFDVGRPFESEPDFGWAVAVLRDDLLDPTERVDRLFAEWEKRR